MGRAVGASNPPFIHTSYHLGREGIGRPYDEKYKTALGLKLELHITNGGNRF